MRDDLDRFIREVGFEPVRHERGHISYGKDERPEEYAYREIDFCEIVVCVIGERFGDAPSDGTSSITQKELKTAVERGKKIYIFVEEAVFHEHRHYLANKAVSGVRYTAVDDTKIHEFLEDVYALPRGNPIFHFGVATDITRMLREQWAGLFQRLLTESSGKAQAALIDELQRSLQTVGKLVEFLKDDSGRGNHAIQQILFANHPLFTSIKQATRNSYRLYFTTLSELEDWLKAARGLGRVNEDMQDEPDVYEWLRNYKQPNGTEEVHMLYINKAVFTEAGDIKPMTPAEWQENFVRYTRTQPDRRPRPPAPKPISGFDDTDDDIPF